MRRNAIPVIVKCKCGKRLSAPDEAVGHNIRCPSCNEVTFVPIGMEQAGDALSGHAPLAEPGPPPTRPFPVEVACAFLYAVRGSAFWILIVAAAINTLRTFLMFGMVTFLLSTFISIFLGFYLAAYFLAIVPSSAGGDRNPPVTPDMTDIWDDMLKPVLLVVAAALVSVGPWLAYTLHATWSGVEPNRAVQAALNVWFAVYFPMAVMAVSVWRSFAAVSPHVVLPAILRIPWQHLLMAAMVWGIWQGHGFVQDGLKEIVRRGSTTVRLVGTFLPFLVWVYFSWVVARIIGITHWVYRKKLGWFRTM